MNARLFLALWPDDEVRAQLAAWRDRWHWPNKATPVRSDRLHMTLHFIGDVSSDRVNSVATALDVPFPPFQLSLGRNVLWPHGIAVLEPDNAPGTLCELHRALAVRLREIALPVDARSFRPHVTLARRAPAAIVRSDGPAVDWQVERYALMRSHPDAYQVLRSYPA